MITRLVVSDNKYRTHSCMYERGGGNGVRV